MLSAIFNVLMFLVCAVMRYAMLLLFNEFLDFFADCQTEVVSVIYSML